MHNGSSPLVSVGLPTFNRASSLTKAIESVLQQTYSNIELIISDNSSTDETQSICENFAEDDRRVTYIRKNFNLGATNNFAEVLKHSSGEYFMWLGDDDWIDDNYIFECVRVLVKNPDYSLVCGKCLYYINQKFTGQGHIMNLSQENGCDRVLSYYQQVSDNGTFYGVMRRNQISNVPMINTMGGDWLMMAVISFLGKIKTLDHVVVHRATREFIREVYFTKLANSLGLSSLQAKFQAKNPHLSIAIAAFNQIFWKDDVYSSLSITQRFYLAMGAFKAVCEKNVLTAIPHGHLVIKLLNTTTRFKSYFAKLVIRGISTNRHG